jgi:hypothetical protein
VPKQLWPQIIAEKEYRAVAAGKRSPEAGAAAAGEEEELLEGPRQVQRRSQGHSTVRQPSGHEGYGVNRAVP